MRLTLDSKIARSSVQSFVCAETRDGKPSEAKFAVSASSSIARTFRVVACLTMVFLPACTSQAAAPITPEPTAASGMAQQVREYLFETLRASDAETSLGSAGQAEAFAGREDLTLLAAKAPAGPVCVGSDIDPITLIQQKARLTNIVIINEDHNAPAHRHFVGQVLRALRSDGFSIYAAEGFTPYDSLDHEPALSRDGWYVNEPIFGRTLQLAKTLGYRLSGYEQTEDQWTRNTKTDAPLDRIDSREQSQVENLIASIFKSDPDAKVIIHVGDSHVSEIPVKRASGERLWMAARLKAATGRDPLTISQNSCRSGSGDIVAAEGRLDADGVPDRNPRLVDLYVGHPPLGLRDGRPSWRQGSGDVAVRIPPQLAALSRPLIIEARSVGASAETVPIDRLMLLSGETLPLLLPQGQYRVEAFGPSGLLGGTKLEVDAK